MGAFREGRSDLDFVAVADRELSRPELERLRAVHLGRWMSALVRDVDPPALAVRMQRHLPA